MRVAVARETREGETRVAMVPELVAKLSALGHEVLVEPGAGAGALHTDEAYAAAGAVLTDDPYSDAELVCSVQPLPRDLARRLASGTVTVSFLPTAAELDLVRDYRDLGVTALAMELVPRISRAQSMDALSSQSLVSGYRCAVVCAGLLRRWVQTVRWLNTLSIPTDATSDVMASALAGIRTTMPFLNDEEDAA